LSNTLQVTDRSDLTGANVHPLQGFGFLESNVTDSYAFNADTQKDAHWAGEHTFSIGFRYERPNYDDVKSSSGGFYPVPSTNASGLPYLPCTTPSEVCPIGGTMYLWSGSLRPAAATCTLCPLYPTGGVAGAPLEPVYASMSRGEFDTGVVSTYGRYHAAYANDAWQMNKFITLSYGVRWEQWRMAGTGSKYTFTDNWAPRVGVAIDPFGDRKTKIYGNFGRYNYQTPLDAAVRSLSGE